jgi:hypothetical protein
VDVDVVVGGGEQQHWADDSAAGDSVGFLKRAVDAQACLVILAHAADEARSRRSVHRSS